VSRRLSNVRHGGGRGRSPLAYFIALEKLTAALVLVAVVR
jgi:hypothetical protein